MRVNRTDLNENRSNIGELGSQDADIGHLLINDGWNRIKFHQSWTFQSALTEKGIKSVRKVQMNSRSCHFLDWYREKRPIFGANEPIRIQYWNPFFTVVWHFSSSSLDRIMMLSNNLHLGCTSEVAHSPACTLSDLNYRENVNLYLLYIRRHISRRHIWQAAAWRIDHTQDTSRSSTMNWI